MPFSTDTENVLDFLEQSTTQGLRKRNDVGVLLEVAAQITAHDHINDLAFHGTHFYGLYLALRREPASKDGYRILEEEFAVGAERLRELMSQLLAHAAQEEVARFDDVYYRMTHGSLRNLVDLAHDFGVLKSVQNAMKRS